MAEKLRAGSVGLARLSPIVLVVALLSVIGCSSTPTVPAARETTPVASLGDAADDPAIWHRSGKESLVLGTDKRSGLNVYSLTGKQQQFLPVGSVNNVDIAGALAVATNRTTITLDTFRLGDDGVVAVAASHPLPFVDPYGVCAFLRDGVVHVYAGDKTGRLQYRGLSESGDLVSLVDEDIWKFESQTEGCVVDTVTSTLYVGEEERGIHAFDVDGPDLVHLGLVTHPSLTFDVEGLTIYQRGKGRFLIASSQGDSTFVVFGLPGLNQVLKFAVGASIDGTIDGVSDTDGLAASGSAMPGFPMGLLVVQDGRNTSPRAPQNFKLVDWREVDALLQDALK